MAALVSQIVDMLALRGLKSYMSTFVSSWEWLDWINFLLYLYCLLEWSEYSQFTEVNETMLGLRMLHIDTVWC